MTASAFPRIRTAIYNRLLTLFLIFTAPGVAFHEAAHALVCDWVRIPMGEIVFFQLGNPPGYVEHGKPYNWVQAFMLSIAPLFVNLLVAVLLLVTAFGVTLSGDSTVLAFAVVCLWLAFSAIVHSLPSPQDIQNLWDYTTDHFIRYVFVPVVAPIYILVNLVHRLGMFYVVFPLAAVAFVGSLWAFQIDPAAIPACVLNGQWGCWESTPLWERLPIEDIYQNAVST